MGEITIEQLIKVASDPQVGLNLDKAGSLFTSADKTIKNAEAWFNLIERGVKVVEKTGLVPGAMRLLGKTYGVDVDTPLKTAGAIVPLSESHKQVMDAVNGLDPGDVAECVDVLNRWFEIKRQAKEPKKELGDGGADKPGAGTPPS